jgi:uncharacterized protein (TIGR00255 family)
LSETSAKQGIYSMTGFARMSGRANKNLAWTLTLKSVNHRYLDLHMRMPSGTESLEMQLRRVLKEKVGRGHLEVSLSLDRSSEANAHFDSHLVTSYVAAFRLAAEQNGLKGDPDLNVIFRLPGVLTEEESSSGEEMEALERDIMAQIDALVSSLNTMRASEGGALGRALEVSMERLSVSVTEAGRLREGVQKSYFDRISQRIETLLSGVADRDRILQEAAMLAERSDVEEEVTRLHTHIEHFRSLLRAGGEIGKKLDFLLQEMNREANTLLSKTSGLAGEALKITEAGLAMKAEIEKSREQVQNLE